MLTKQPTLVSNKMSPMSNGVSEDSQIDCAKCK